MLILIHFTIYKAANSNYENDMSRGTPVLFLLAITFGLSTLAITFGLSTYW